MASSDRIPEWDLFDQQMRMHIEQYTLTQYGNPEGNEHIDTLSAEECIEHIMRYARRSGKGARGALEDLRDLLKIAHYAAVAFHKKGQIYGISHIYSPAADLGDLRYALTEEES